MAIPQEESLNSTRPAEALRPAPANSTTVFSDVCRSVWPQADKAWLSAAELGFHRQNMRYAGPVLALSFLFVAQCFSDWVPASVRWGWAVPVAILSLVLNVVANKLASRPPRTLREIRIRTLRQTALAFVYVMSVCSMGVIFWVPDVLLDHMLIAVLLLVSLAASMSMSAPHPATAVIGLLGRVVFLVIPLSLSHYRLDHMLAWISSLFIILIGMRTIAVHRFVKTLSMLEHERSGLVEGLLAAKADSDRDRARAVAAGRAKSQFLSNMNHELRTPMNAILGFSDLIRNRAFGSAVDKYVEYAEIIHQSGLHLLRLIDDVLDLAKIDGGRLSLRESEISFSQLMADIFAEYAESAATAGISLSKQIEPGLPRVYADERALRNILKNLASNAFKFTPAGGCVALFAHLEPDGQLAFGFSDTGIGIAEADLAHVFERFGVGRHDITAADKGTGLGLAVVKGFAESHDGDVKLESTLGVGTRVTVHLPANRLRCEPLRESA